LQILRYAYLASYLWKRPSDPNRRSQFALAALPGPQRTELAVTQSSPRITLAEGTIAQSDKLVVELVDSKDTPKMILINWPAQPTPVRPVAYGDIASKIMRILARANIELARIRARKL
jgi:hypothetical protein